MSNIAVIPQFNISAELAQQFSMFLGGDDLNAGVSGGFPVMSIRGAKWRMVEGGEETPICMPGTKDLAPFVKVVLVRSNRNLSKTFYAGAYVEGSDAPPDCSSVNGDVPHPDSPNIQSEACATCPQNVWGSKISPSGAKIKACADVRRMAILPADDMEYSPILLRVPGASLSDLAAYGKALSKRGIPYAAVVTKLAFDADAAYPKITFQFDRVLTPAEMALVASRINEPIVDDILGLSDLAVASAAPKVSKEDDKFGIPADAAAPAGAKDADLDAAVSKVEQASTGAAIPAKPRARAKPGAGFGGAAQQEAAAPAAESKPEPAATTTTSGGDMLSDIDDALAGLNF